MYIYIYIYTHMFWTHAGAFSSMAGGSISSTWTLKITEEASCIMIAITTIITTIIITIMILVMLIILEYYVLTIISNELYICNI